MPQTNDIYWYPPSATYPTGKLLLVKNVTGNGTQIEWADGTKSKVESLADAVKLDSDYLYRLWLQKPPVASAPAETLRDWLAMSSPKPPCATSDSANKGEAYWNELRSRYSYADRIIKELR